MLPYSLLLSFRFVYPLLLVIGYEAFVGRYVTGGRKRFRPYKVYTFWPGWSHVSQSVCLLMSRLSQQSATPTL